MNLRKSLKPKGGRARRFITWLTYGAIAGALTGMLVGVIWVSVDWIITIRSGSSPALAWVIKIYEIGATVFGLGGLVLGVIVGSVIGILEFKNAQS
jgi:hypothetical protein